MDAKKVKYCMVFGQAMDGFAMTPDSIEYYPGCRPEGPSGPPAGEAPQGAPAGAPQGPGPGAPGGPDGPAATPPVQEFELTITGEGKGLLRSEHGIQKVDDIVESPFSLSFTAYSGSNGDEVFRYVLMSSDSTAQLVGFACGIKPFFRSFMPLRGEIVENA